MALVPRLDLRQSQQLVMTPQLQQAIKLLQFNNIELSAFLAAEIEQNPFLEMGESESMVEGEMAPETEAPMVEASSTDHLEDGSDFSSSNDAPLDTDFETNVFNNDSPSDTVFSGGGALGGERNDSTDGDLIEQTVEESKSLRDHVTDDMLLIFFDPGERLIATHLIDLLDDCGYLSDGWQEVADRLGCDNEDVETVIRGLQTIEPAGLFARSLKECLALQLRELDRLDPAMQALLENLELLAKHDMAALKRRCGVDAEDLAQMIAEIRDLNPRPGNTFGSELLQPVIPDVFIRKGAGGLYQVTLNSDTLPKVLVNNTYYSELNRRAGSRQEKSYLTDSLANANWLTRALDQRARTILKVATELVNQQIGFFDDGVGHLKPLNLKTIADAIEMHESTVSRVTANKYLACDRGIFDMKFFFTSAIQSSDGGEAHASEAVRHRIRAHVDAELASAVLSDDDLVALLKKDGIDIARRTVTKYRESMDIRSSIQRRRQKRMQG